MAGPELDAAGADSTLQMVRHLTGPLSGAVQEDTVPIAGDGAVQPSTGWRDPFLFLVLAQDLDGAALAVEVTDAGVPPVTLARLAFPGWSEHGTRLPLPIDPAAPFRLAARLGDAAVAGPLAAWLSVRLLDGRIGRLLHLFGAEQGRVRQQARALRAAALLDGATGATLDRMGVDLGVPRFVSGTAAEPDAAYRARLRLFRRLAIGTPARVQVALDGLAGAGRLRLVEDPAPLSIGLHLVAIDHTAEAAQARRAAFLDQLRAAQLVDPLAAPAADAVLPPGERQARQDRAARLQALLAPPPDPPLALAPSLVAVLDAFARTLAALGLAMPLQAAGAADADEAGLLLLGLGSILAPVAPAALAALAAAVAAADPPPSGDRVALGVLRRLRRAGGTVTADAPGLAALWRACGARTVESLSGGRVLVSVQPGGALVIQGDATAALPPSGGPVLVPLAARHLAAAAGGPAPAVRGRAGERVRWRVIPLDGPAPALARAIGPATQLRATAPATALVMTLRLDRGQGTDPFEARVEPADPGLMLDLAGWEALAETLRRLRPIGIGIDTWRLRDGHVVIDPAEGPAAPADPRLRRGIRPWRQTHEGADR